MIIDIHTHVFPPAMAANRRRYAELDRWFALLYGEPRAKMASAEDLLAEMAASGVDVAAVCAFGWADLGLCSEHNDYLLEAARRYPGKLLPFVAVPPPAGRAAVAELRRAAFLGAKGIGELMPDGQGFSLDDERLLAPIVATADELGLPLLSHTSEPLGHLYPGKGTVKPEMVYRFASRFPQARLICGHWGGGLPFYELMPEVAAVLANVYYDTAAGPFLYRPAVFRTVAAAAGTAKILFGTDYPLLGQRRFLAHVRQAGLDAESLVAVLGGNAARLLGLEDS